MIDEKFRAIVANTPQHFDNLSQKAHVKYGLG